MSNRQNQTLAETGAFKLVRRKKKDRLWYEVQFNSWDHPYEPNPDNLYEQVRNFFDPLRNKSGRWATNWKYSNRKDAEQMYATALLKFS